MGSFWTRLAPIRDDYYHFPSWAMASDAHCRNGRERLKDIEFSLESKMNNPDPDFTSHA